MGTYSIKELERLSGIRAHTIRIWEKRHQLIEPQRNRSNVRLYSDHDLKKIINVSLLNSNGFRISSIVKMSDEELVQKVLELGDARKESKIHVDRLVTIMLDLDENQFEKELARLEKKFGMETTVTDVIYPFLEKIGVLWQTGNITPAHEHFISNLIRQKIIVGIASLPLVTKGTIRAVLFLPENELHEIGLLFYHYIARKCGFKTFYLGQSVPHDDLKVVCNMHRPHLLITSITSSVSGPGLNPFLLKLSKDFPESRILVSGAAVRKSSLRIPQNVTFFETAVDLKHLLLKLK